jgi:hypothetical protein
MTSPSSDKTQGIIAYMNQVIDVYQTLEKQTDLSPRNPVVNRALSAFVQATMQPRPDDEVRAILQNPIIQKIAPPLRQLLGRAEYEMECYSAEVFTGQRPKPRGDRYGDYNNFIYRDNYEALVDIEMKALGWPQRQPALNRTNQSVAFLGAGPWPMSALILHERTGLPITCIDSDAKACALGRAVINKLAETEPRFADLPSKVTYVHAPGDRYDYITHPVVIVASLVDRKDPVIMRIIGSSDTHRTVVIRSAERLSALLYEPHQPAGGLEDYNFYFALKTENCPAAVNTSLVYRIPKGKMRARNKIDFVLDDGSAIRPLGPRRWRTQSHLSTI